MKITTQVTQEMRIAALEAAVETLLLERETGNLASNKLAADLFGILSQQIRDVSGRVEQLELEAIDRAEMVRIAEEKKREAYVTLQKALATPLHIKDDGTGELKARDYSAKLFWAQCAEEKRDVKEQQMKLLALHTSMFMGPK